jgi:hypothetical protein
MTVLTNVYSSRNNITSTVVYDDPDLGVVIQEHHNPRGRPSIKTQHSVDKSSTRNKIQKLRNDLSIDSKKKWYFSYHLWQMKWLRKSKNPETWFIDVTSRANIQKRDLFILVVRKPDGTCISSIMLP